MEVLGRDTVLEAYRVVIGDGDTRIVGLVPERLFAGSLSDGTPRHDTAYDWLDRHSRRIEAALRAITEGRPVRAPFDAVQLAEET